MTDNTRHSNELEQATSCAWTAARIAKKIFTIAYSDMYEYLRFFRDFYCLLKKKESIWNDYSSSADI